ncbi:MAG: hypothetical protein WC323_02060, partial [Patescibacteria group bacterium]
MHYYQKLILFINIIIFCVLLASPTLADIPNPTEAIPGIPPASTVAPEHTGSQTALTNPLTGSASDVTGGIPAIIGKIINAVLGIVGS